MTRSSGTFFHFFGRYILFMGGDVPNVAKGVDEAADAVAIELICNRPLHGGSGGDGLREDGVNIFNIEMHADGRAAK